MLYICFAFKDQRDATALPTCGRGLPRISRALVIYASEGETSTVFGKKFFASFRPLWKMLLLILYKDYVKTRICQ